MDYFFERVGTVTLFVCGSVRLGNTHDDGDVENHAGHVAGLGSPQRVDELAERTAQGVRQAGQGRGGDPAARGEPQVGVAGRGGQDKGLGEADEDLAGHGGAVVAAPGGGGAGVAHPVAEDDEDGGDHEGQLGPAVQHGDGDGEDGDESQEEGGADPVDGGVGDAVVRGGEVGDGGKGEPL